MLGGGGGGWIGLWVFECMRLETRFEGFAIVRCL